MEEGAAIEEEPRPLFIEDHQGEEPRESILAGDPKAMIEARPPFHPGGLGSLVGLSEPLGEPLARSDHTRVPTVLPEEPPGLRLVRDEYSGLEVDLIWVSVSPFPATTATTQAPVGVPW
jgi:hypothetical protein